MSTPTASQQYVDKLLTQFSIAYRNQNYISEMILPVVNAKKSSGKFATYGKDAWRIDVDLTRAPGAPAKELNYRVSNGAYSMEERALSTLVDERQIENADDPYDPRRDATLMVLDRIWLAAEASLAASMADTGVITNNVTLSATDQWSDVANSDPFTNIQAAKKAVKLACGMNPNVAVMGYNVWLVLKEHPDVVDRVKYVGSKTDEEMMRAIADLIGVKKVLIGDAVKNTANPGQDDSLDFVWGNHFWVFYQPERPALWTPAFGYTIKKAKVNRKVERWYDIARVGDMVRVRDEYDQLITDATACYLIKNAVA